MFAEAHSHTPVSSVSTPKQTSRHEQLSPHPRGPVHVRVRAVAAERNPHGVDAPDADRSADLGWVSPAGPADSLRPSSMSWMRSDLVYLTELINPTFQGIYIKTLACGSEMEF